MSDISPTLIAKKSTLVTRDQLREIPTPPPRGPRHLPVPHHTLVETLTGVLQEAGLQIAEERFAVGKGGGRLFGVLKVRPVEGQALIGSVRPGQEFAIGLRSGNQGDLALKVAAGLNVVVCDNLVLAGSFLALKKKHTIGLRLDAALREAVERYVEQQVGVVEQTDAARQLPLTDDEAKLEIFNVFERRLLSPRLFPEVVANYFTPAPGWTDCQGRHRFALHNAFTRALRESPPPVQFRATAALAYLLHPSAN